VTALLEASAMVATFTQTSVSMLSAVAFASEVSTRSLT
jgi:hypothetical protein